MSDRYQPPNIPRSFRDPLTGEFLKDPWIASDGQTYNIGTVKAYPDTFTVVYPNHNLKQAIQAWVLFSGISDNDLKLDREIIGKVVGTIDSMMVGSSLTVSEGQSISRTAKKSWEIRSGQKVTAGLDAVDVAAGLINTISALELTEWLKSKGSGCSVSGTPSRSYKTLDIHPDKLLGDILKKLAKKPTLVSGAIGIPSEIKPDRFMQVLNCMSDQDIFTFAPDAQRSRVVVKQLSHWIVFDWKGFKTSSEPMSEPQDVVNELPKVTCVVWKTEVHADLLTLAVKHPMVAVGVNPLGKASTVELSPGHEMKAAASLIGFGLFKINIRSK